MIVLCVPRLISRRVRYECQRDETRFEATTVRLKRKYNRPVTGSLYPEAITSLVKISIDHPPEPMHNLCSIRMNISVIMFVFRLVRARVIWKKKCSPTLNISPPPSSYRHH